MDGLEYLHSCGVIHRDIKCSNVLLNKGQVKLADFGCSKKTYFTSDASEHQHSMIGTTIYMAPEVMKSDGQHADDDAAGECKESGSQSRMTPPPAAALRVETRDMVTTAKSGYGRKADIWGLGRCKGG